MITLRHATLSDRENVYRWLCLSDTASMHMGAPEYPDSPIPDRVQFLEDFEDFYFLESTQDKGSVIIISCGEEEIGCLCYACFHLKPQRAELDIWLKGQMYCGKGYGPAALLQATDYLTEVKGINSFIIRPSEKNLRAIAAYEKAGFKRVADKEAILREFLSAEYKNQYENGDYGFENTAILTK